LQFAPEIIFLLWRAQFGLEFPERLSSGSERPPQRSVNGLLFSLAAGC
jgi:hypothetical protein